MNRQIGASEKTNTDNNIDRELADTELEQIAGGNYTKQKPDGTGGGNVAAKWSVAQGAAA